jgi:hypothetical protein
MTPLTDKQRIKRLEAAVNQLAWLETRLAAIRPGTCPELDAIRVELAGSIVPGGQERRPFAGLPEQRERVNA